MIIGDYIGTTIVIGDYIGNTIVSGDSIGTTIGIHSPISLLSGRERRVWFRFPPKP